MFSVAAGPGASNVIPDSVELQGSVRALTQETFDRLHSRIETIVTSTADMYGCTANVSWSHVPYPPTVNDAAMVNFVKSVAEALVPEPRKGAASTVTVAARGRLSHAFNIFVRVLATA